MAGLAEPATRRPHDFEIVQDELGHWIARDRDGLVGGVFRTQKDAIRFALFEADGDSARVHILSAEPGK